MIDKKYIGKQLPAYRVTPDASQLRFFAKAIGETNPIFSDVQAACAAGHPHLPLPPTFLFSLEFEQSHAGWRQEIGVEQSRILHGEQRFDYHRMAYVGDTLLFESHLADIYDRKDGALEFIVRCTRVSNARGEHVADLRSTIVQRN
jgi:acyl dehydratase